MAAIATAPPFEERRRDLTGPAAPRPEHPRCRKSHVHGASLERRDDERTGEELPALARGQNSAHALGHRCPMHSHHGPARADVHRELVRLRGIGAKATQRRGIGPKSDRPLKDADFDGGHSGRLAPSSVDGSRGGGRCRLTDEFLVQCWKTRGVVRNFQEEVQPS
jgi:hypothetical protein